MNNGCKVEPEQNAWGCVWWCVVVCGDGGLIQKGCSVGCGVGCSVGANKQRNAATRRDWTICFIFQKKYLAERDSLNHKQCDEGQMC
jgi:hypothetical protein